MSPGPNKFAPVATAHPRGIRLSGAQMSRNAKRVTISAVFVVLGGLFLLLMARGLLQNPHGTGSMRHARKSKEKLATCTSLDDVRKKFNCGIWKDTGKDSAVYIRDPNTFREGNTWALLYDLPNGDWLAMAYASSHGHKGGGTVVTRDSTGRIRAFFGHVCGRPFAVGESLEEIYMSFEEDDLGNWKEVSLNE